MNNINKEILYNGKFIYDYLSVYGVDRYNTKKDLILLSHMRNILELNCYYNVLNECSINNIYSFISKILNNNPQLKYCRINVNDYKNLGSKQNIDTYKRIDNLIN
jgi:hypothetical protein